jgi:hypothetical protein
MNILVEIVISLVGMMFGHVSAFLSSLSDGVLLLTSGGGLLLAFASGIVVSHDAVVRHTIPEGVLATIDRQHHEDFEAQVREVERQRQEIERLHAELNAKK